MARLNLTSITYRRALLVAAEAVGLTESDLRLKSQKQAIAHARFGIWAALFAAGASLSEIGRAAGKDHSSVANGIARVKAGRAYQTAYPARDAVAVDLVKNTPRQPEPVKEPPPPEPDDVPSPVNMSKPLPSNRREAVAEILRRQAEMRALIERENERLGMWG